MSHTIRIVVADDHAIVRRALVQFLGSKEDMTIIGEAPDGAALISLLESEQPDVILMDYNMPEVDGVEATRQIHARYPQICVIGISMHEDGPVERDMLNAGAVAYIPKKNVAQCLEHAIRRCTSQEQTGPADA